MTLEARLKKLRAEKSTLNAEKLDLEEKVATAKKSKKSKATITRYENQVVEKVAKIKALNKKIKAVKDQIAASQVEEETETVEETPVVEKKTPKMVVKTTLYDVYVNPKYNKSLGGYMAGKIKTGSEKPAGTILLKKGVKSVEADSLIEKVNNCQSKDEFDAIYHEIRGTQKTGKVITPKTDKVQKNLLKKDTEDKLMPIVNDMTNIADTRNANSSATKVLLHKINTEIRAITEETQARGFYKNPDNIEDMIDRLEILLKNVKKYNQQVSGDEDDLTPTTSFSSIMDRVHALKTFSEEINK